RRGRPAAPVSVAAAPGDRAAFGCYRLCRRRPALPVPEQVVAVFPEAPFHGQEHEV
ncbi:hypothetical protein GGH99_008667, partial [Coemansia sp. RSA 1285]